MNSLYDEVLLALHAISRRRMLALSVCWAIAVIGWTIIGFIPNRYESQARVLVATQSLLADKAGLTPADRQQGIDAVRQTLTSTALLQNVVRTTDLARLADDNRGVADLATKLARTIKVIAQQDNLFQVTVSAGFASLSDAQNAAIARQITQRLIDLFVEGNVVGARTDTGQTLLFLDAQLKARGAQLSAAEARRSEFAAKYMSLLPGTGTIEDRLNAARSEIARIDSDLMAARSGLAAVNGQLAATPPSSYLPGSVGSNAGPGASVEAQIADGRARGWTDAHPDMVALRQQLARTRAAVSPGVRAAAGTTTPNPTYASLRSLQAEKAAVAASLAARREQIQEQVDGVAAARAADPERAAQQTQLDRDYAVLKTQYDKLLGDREDVNLRGQVQTQTNAVKFSVIDAPSMPSAPAAPNRPLLLTLVFLAAIASGAGTAFGVSQMRTTFATAPGLARSSGLPVIGTIGAVVTEAGRDAQRRVQRRVYGGIGGLTAAYAIEMVVEFVQRSGVA